MAWGKLEGTFGRDIKWKRLGKLLGIPRAQAAGHVACLYSWAVDNAQDGDVSDFGDEEIEEQCLWEGEPGALAKALRHQDIGVLEKARGGTVIHQFFERAESHKAAIRKRRERDKRKNADETVTRQDRDSHEKVTGEREREKEERERGEGEKPELPPPTDSVRELAASGIPADKASALYEVYRSEMQTRRGHSLPLMATSMHLRHARTLLTMADMDAELAANVVRAYVRSDHEWWKGKRWALGVLADVKDFEHAMQLAAKSVANKHAQETTQEPAGAKIDNEMDTATPRERAASLRASAAEMRKLSPGSAMANHLEAQADRIEAGDDT